MFVREVCCVPRLIVVVKLVDNIVAFSSVSVAAEQMNRVVQANWGRRLKSTPAQPAAAASDCERLQSARASAPPHQRTHTRGRYDPCSNVYAGFVS